MSTYEELKLDPTDRILILAPHPDDETIATGGVIQKALALGLPVRVVWLTYGDNAETAFIAYRRRPIVRGKGVQAMGLVRHDEGVAAAGVLGLRPDQLTFLGYPDFRTLVMWCEHWGDCEPCESMFTRTKVVPYTNALRPGTPYRADEILKDIKEALSEFQPTKVFVSHPGDHNPDHLSLYLFTRVALWDLAAAGALDRQPEIFPFLVHHPAFPTPGTNFRAPLLPPERLVGEGTWTMNHLAPEFIERKHAALQKHQTQTQLSAAYLETFIRANELFGDFHLRMLERGNSAEILSMTQINPQVIPAQLTNAERVKWVGVERRAVWQEDDNVIVAVDFSRPLGNEVGAVTYLFGYRPDRPFAQMPKIQIRLTEEKSFVMDQSTRLVKPPVQLLRSPKGFVMRVPLGFLGDPCYIMGSVRTFVGKVPLDWIAWRILEIPQGA